MGRKMYGVPYVRTGTRLRAPGEVDCAVGPAAAAGSPDGGGSRPWRCVRFGIAIAAAALPAAFVFAQAPDPAAIKTGASIYSQNCAQCHGPRMRDPQGAFDLRTFPREEKARFVQSVAKGRNAMPPWGDILSAAEIDALWVYVIDGER